MPPHACHLVKPQLASDLPFLPFPVFIHLFLILFIIFSPIGGPCAAPPLFSSIWGCVHGANPSLGPPPVWVSCPMVSVAWGQCPTVPHAASLPIAGRLPQAGRSHMAQGSLWQKDARVLFLTLRLPSWCTRGWLGFNPETKALPLVSSHSLLCLFATCHIHSHHCLSGAWVRQQPSV